MPFISIIIPTYNSSKYLKETIYSILRQTYSNYEIIIVDDGSTDNTHETISAFKDNRIKYLKQNINSGGPSKPRNIAIAESKGDLIALFDSDDIMAENKLEEAALLFSQNTADFFFTNFSSIDESGTIVKENYLKEYVEFRKILARIGPNKNWFALNGDVYLELLKANFIGTSSVVFKKSIVDDLGLFDEKLKNGDDIDLWFRIAAAKKRMIFSKCIGHYYRQRVGSISHRGLNNIESIITLWEKQRFNSQSDIHLKIIKKRLSNAYIRYGWQTSQLKNYHKAIEHYQKSLTYNLSFIGIRGFIANIIRQNLRFKRVT